VIVPIPGAPSRTGRGRGSLVTGDGAGGVSGGEAALGFAAVVAFGFAAVVAFAAVAGFGFGFAAVVGVGLEPAFGLTAFGFAAAFGFVAVAGPLLAAAVAAAGCSKVLGAVARREPIRVGRVAGSAPRTPGSSGRVFGFCFFGFWALSAMALRVYGSHRGRGARPPSKQAPDHSAAPSCCSRSFLRARVIDDQNGSS
jgi:hypothetical protein